MPAGSSNAWRGADGDAVSVIVPAWNAAATLAETLRSVLEQSYPADEILVLDDGSTDETQHVVAAFAPRIDYLRQANGGPSAARNAGLEATQADLVAFLDADDIWLPRALELLSAPLGSNPEVAASRGMTVDLYADPDGSASAGLSDPYWGFNVGSALFRRSALAGLGGFDPSLLDGEDVDLWLRLREQRLACRRVESVVLRYRQRPGDVRAGQERHVRTLVRSLKRSLDRSRQVGS
jgi:glycosyltransferase involved in cell wall biosynthesis